MLPAMEATHQSQTSQWAEGPPICAPRQGACWGASDSCLEEIFPKPQKPQKDGGGAHSAPELLPHGPLTCFGFSTGRGLVGGAGLSCWEWEGVVRTPRPPWVPFMSSLGCETARLARQVQPQSLLPRGLRCAPSLLTWPGACGGYTGRGDGGLAMAAGG